MPFSREAHEIPDDEEIPRKSHLANDVQLVTEAILSGLGGRVAVAFAQALLAELAQVGVRLLAIGRSKDRKMPRLQVQLNGAAVRNLLAPPDSVRMVGEKTVHLLGRPDIELVAAVSQPVLVVASLAGVDTEEDVVGVAIPLAEIMGVAGRDERQAKTVRDVDRPFGAETLDVEAVVLDLDVEIAAKQAGEPLGRTSRLVPLVLEDKLAELARRTTAQADDAFMVGGQQLLVDPRDVVVALEKSDRRHPDQVLEAGPIFCQKGEVKSRVTAAPRLAFGPQAGRHVSLIADDRVEASGPALAVKLDGPVKIAVIGQGQGVHAQLLGPRHELRDSAGAVEQTVMTVAMKMNERSFRHSVLGPGSAGQRPTSKRAGGARRPSKGIRRRFYTPTGRRLSGLSSPSAMKNTPSGFWSVRLAAGACSSGCGPVRTEDGSAEARRAWVLRSAVEPGTRNARLATRCCRG